MDFSSNESEYSKKSNFHNTSVKEGKTLEMYVLKQNSPNIFNPVSSLFQSVQNSECL